MTIDGSVITMVRHCERSQYTGSLLLYRLLYVLRHDSLFKVNEIYLLIGFDEVITNHVPT